MYSMITHAHIIRGVLSSLWHVARSQVHRSTPPIDYCCVPLQHNGMYSRGMFACVSVCVSVPFTVWIFPTRWRPVSQTRYSNSIDRCAPPRRAFSYVMQSGKRRGFLSRVGFSLSFPLRSGMFVHISRYNSSLLCAPSTI